MSSPTYTINAPMREHMAQFRERQRFPSMTDKQTVLAALDAAIHRLESGWTPTPSAIRAFLAADEAPAERTASIVRDEALTTRLARLGELLVALNNRFLTAKLIDVRRRNAALPYVMRLTIAAALWIAVDP